jgi:CRP-like cAMP-binding protein
MSKVHSYGSGNSFGELALKDNKPRAATIVTTQDCYFATISKSDYKRCLAKFEQRTITQLIEYL